jgi:hypothetical protein
MKKPSPRPEADSGRPPKPKVLLVGEGPQDIGRPEEPGGALAGFLQAALVSPGEPVTNDSLCFSIARVMRWTELQIQKLPRKPRTLQQLLKLKPDGERARAAIVVASVEGYDCVAILRDCEHAANIGLGDLLREAREAYSGADQSETPRPGLVVAAPSRCHETWLLADREAVRSIMDDHAIYHFSMDPELRPHCDDLKHHLNEHALRLHQSVADVRRYLAFRARPVELSRRCTHCYPPFQADVDNELRAHCFPDPSDSG